MSRIAVASRDRAARPARAARVVQGASHPEHGKHVEVDLSRQVMALLRGGKVYRLYGVSSGKASTPTVLGRFKIYSLDDRHQCPRDGRQQLLHRRLRIHGYVSVPTFPASYACVRVPIPNALSIYNWLRIGDRVDVYP